MKSKQKNDLARARFDNLRIEDLIDSNLSYQSTQRTLFQDFKIKEYTSSYFLGPVFKVKFSKLNDDNQIKVCRLLSGMRSKELMEKLKE